MRRFILILTMLFAALAASHEAPAPRTPDQDAVTSLAQPKLRRLHLVRPDLIYYPLPTMVVC